MDKVNFKALSFELTRKCNLRCAHCFRGEPQKKDIDYNVIDRALNEVNYIETLNCTGGEPLLNIDAIKYIVDFVIEKRINVRWFTITTNGTIMDEQVSDLLNRMGKYIIDIRKTLGYESALQCGANITISSDKFHENNPDQAVLFYRKHCNSCVFVQKQESGKLEGTNNTADDGLVYAGRAKKLSENNFIVDSPFHKIKFEHSMVKCPIEVSGNGNINISAYQSFENIDKYAMGNI